MVTTFDIIVLLVIAAGAVLGGLRGFVTELLSLFAWVAAIFALKMLHTPVSALLAPMLGTIGGAAVLAFVLVFGAVFMLGKVIAGSLGRRTRQSILGPFDRLLGVGFGALKGLLGATMVFLAFNLVFDVWTGRDAERPQWLRASRTYPLLNASGRAVVDFVQLRRGALKPQDLRPSNAQGGGKV